MNATLLGLPLALISLAALAWGTVTEFRQTRERGPIALTPTLPFAVFSVLVMTAAIVALGFSASLRWWIQLGAILGYAASVFALYRVVSRTSPGSAEDEPR